MWTTKLVPNNSCDTWKNHDILQAQIYMHTYVGWGRERKKEREKERWDLGLKQQREKCLFVFFYLLLSKFKILCLMPSLSFVSLPFYPSVMVNSCNLLISYKHHMCWSLCIYDVRNSVGLKGNALQVLVLGELPLLSPYKWLLAKSVAFAEVATCLLICWHRLRQSCDVAVGWMVPFSGFGRLHLGSWSHVQPVYPVELISVSSRGQLFM